MGIKCPKCQSDNPETATFCADCGAKITSPKDIGVTKTLITPTEKLQKGSIIAGRYQILEELGRGGMGVVYKAEDTKLKRTVALKFLPPELTHISEVKERFMREAQAAAALDHPNICTIYEFDEAEEKTFISMAYIEGHSLKKKIESGPLELDEAIRIALQVAEGLQKAHKKGVVHRDIKSANIMVTEEDQAKIMDFGLARTSERTLVTKEGTTMGTIAYMSPEQARGEEVDHRTDIWSSGVVLYEILTGQLPFKGEYDQAVVYSILKEKPKPIADLRAEVPRAIEQVIGKALEKNADDRYQQIEDLLNDLRSISEGIVPERVKARLRKVRLLRRKKVFLYASTAGLLIIMAVIVLSLFTGRAEAIDSIAVLPMENLSGDPEQEYFSEGVTDALINELAKISALRVISRTSVMQYKKVRKSLREIARELDVEVVVEGSVLTTGGSVQIRTRLIQADSEQNLWAQSYERDISNILILQSEVAQTIAREIDVKLTGDEQTRLASARPIIPEAYEAYLKGQYYRQRWTLDATKRAIEYFQQAIQLDPNYAAAYAGLAECYLFPEIDAPKAKEAALKALEIDGSLGEAHAALASIYGSADWDWIGAEREYKRALELNPNDTDLLHWYSHYLMAMGNTQEALAVAKRSVEIDPLSPTMNCSLGENYLHARQYDQAIVWIRKALVLDPDLVPAYFFLGRAYLYKGMYEEAIATVQNHKEKMMRRTLLGYAYAKAGRRAEAMEIIEQMLALPKKWFNSEYRIAVIYAALDEKDQAFYWLEKALETRYIWLMFLKVEPELDPLRDDPRFKDLLRRMNFPE
jgi:serine/threonine-protein kinase